MNKENPAASLAPEGEPPGHPSHPNPYTKEMIVIVLHPCLGMVGGHNRQAGPDTLIPEGRPAAIIKSNYDFRGGM